MARLARIGVVALACILLSNRIAVAQTGSIAGVVKDTSGAVLPDDEFETDRVGKLSAVSARLASPTAEVPRYGP